MPRLWHAYSVWWAAVPTCLLIPLAGSFSVVNDALKVRSGEAARAGSGMGLGGGGGLAVGESSAGLGSGESSAGLVAGESSAGLGAVEAAAAASVEVLDGEVSDGAAPMVVRVRGSIKVVVAS